METPPVEVVIKLYGLTTGESEFELSIPEASALGRLMAAADPTEQARLFGRLRRHLVAELADAFSSLEASPTPAPGAGPRPTRLTVAVGGSPSAGGGRSARGPAG